MCTMKEFIEVQNARVHNLKEVSVKLPRNKLIVFTGMSGSGKSSLAFDTIYAEGQRRYMESLSAYARQFLDQLDKPDVDFIDGLSPAISIDQKSSSHNPRSTVGTITEIYDYYRLFFASVGKAHCPSCRKPVSKMSIQEIHGKVKSLANENERIQIMAPLIKEKKGEFRTLFEELQKDGFSRVQINGEMRRLDEGIRLNKNFKYTIDVIVDRLKVNNENESRLYQSIETATAKSEGLVTIMFLDQDKNMMFSEHLTCADCNISIEEISHRLFSFNSPIGACPDCKGIGDNLDFDADLVVENPKDSIRHCTSKVMNLDNTYYGRSVAKLGSQKGFSLDDSFNSLSKEQQNLVLYGTEDAQEENPFLDETRDVFGEYYEPWEGIITNLRRRYIQTQSESMRHFFKSFMSSKPCDTCKGARLRPTALGVLVNKENIASLSQLNVQKSLQFFEKLKLNKHDQEISAQILREIKSRLEFLNNVGLGYLNINRKSGTLSGGEFQRIRLATQIGAGLTGVLYVLDEPSIGLHQRDNHRLIETLKRLRDLGNTLIVVEHDEDTIKASDYVVEIGPEAGKNGGNIVFSGDIEAFMKDKKSLTAQYIQHQKEIVIPKNRRKAKKGKALSIIGATEHNLKNVSVDFPLGVLICVTGVSGSGKSTLIHDIMHNALMKHFFNSKTRPGDYKEIKGLEHIDKLITIDQSAIGKTPRSNPATYAGVFGPIRELFVQLPEAKMRGYKAGRFSFNVKGGRCEACEGDGVKKIEMHFLSDVYVTCDECKGKRYNRETLEVKYKGYSISDVLKMTVNEGCKVFENIPAIYNKLKTLQDVGLGYIHLGQNATTLSGGEAQRVKLAKELSKRSTGKTLYLLDEPTTGLHFEDIAQLLKVLQRLVDAGNTIVVIEHNLDVIKTADHIIDLGPEGGDGGGKIIATGTPEEVAKVKESHTGYFLKDMLHS